MKLRRVIELSKVGYEKMFDRVVENLTKGCEVNFNGNFDLSGDSALSIGPEARSVSDAERVWSKNLN